MSNLSKFWNAIESLPSLAAVEAEWQHLLGCEYRLAKSFLRATQKVALSLPAADGNRHYEVVEHGRDDLVGICQETGETITLTRNQLAVYELDQQRLAVQVANTLGLSAANRVATKDIRLFSLGTFRPTTHSVTAFLMVPSDAAAVAAAAAWLISQGASPFLIITPTRSFVTGELILRLRSLGSASLSLADALVVCDNGKWAISDGAIKAALPDRPVEEEPLNNRAQSVLVAMLELGAIDSDQRRSTEEIAVKALGKGTDPNALKSVMVDLKTRKLIKSKTGAGGGCWLTEAGRLRAEKLNKSWRNSATVSTPFAHR